MGTLSHSNHFTTRSSTDPPSDLVQESNRSNNRDVPEYRTRATQTSNQSARPLITQPPHLTATPNTNKLTERKQSDVKKSRSMPVKILIAVVIFLIILILAIITLGVNYFSKGT